MAQTRLIRLAALIMIGAICAACADAVYRSMNDPARAEWQKPHEVVKALRIDEGAAIADLGAGGGYFTFFLADAVGRTGRVYAVDTDQRSLDFIRAEYAQRGEVPRTVQFVLASPDDPQLPEESLDLVFTCNTCHHLSDRPAYLRALRRHLRHGGRVAIIDFRPTGWAWLFGHATEKETVRDEMAAAGYRLVDEFDFLPKQHFQVFAAAGS